MTNNTYNVCFVCSGNACRSPFAETVMKTLLADEPALDINVFSRGTIDWGKNSRDPEMMATAKAMGYEMEGETTCMTYEDLQAADIIIVFSQEHRNKVTRVLDYAHWDRIVLFDAISFGLNTEVEDPNYQSEAVYCRVAKHIEDGCRSIIMKWKENPPMPRN